LHYDRHPHDTSRRRDTLAAIFVGVTVYIRAWQLHSRHVLEYVWYSSNARARETVCNRETKDPARV